MRLSRRAFIGAAAGIGLGTAVGLGTRRGRRALHAAGLLGTSDRIPPASSLLIKPGALASGRRFAVVRTGSGARPLAVLLCLHGRGSNERFAFETLRIHDFARELGLDLLIAAIDGGGHSYWHRRANRDDALGEAVEGLLPQLQVRAGGAPVAVMGWSMGGFGALLAGLEYPRTFRAIVAVSAPVWPKFEDSARGAFDDAADFQRHDVLRRIDGLRSANVRLDCGADDPFVELNRRLFALLPTARGSIAPGFHDAAFWRNALPAQLGFLRGAVAEQ